LYYFFLSSQIHTYWYISKKYSDIANIKIKSITIEASKKVNTTDDKIKVLENKLETLKDISEPSRQQLEELADLENQIHSHYENKTDAARLRAKVDWYEKGEQSTKYFFNLERKNGQNKFWQKIRSLDGNLKYDIDEILDEQINVYANYFQQKGGIKM
jgi:flagellar biosynthesis GTPase FlhF